MEKNMFPDYYKDSILNDDLKTTVTSFIENIKTIFLI